MNIEQSVEIIKSAFGHLIFEENEIVGDALALLYFPSIGIGVFHADNELEEQRIKKALSIQSAHTSEKVTPVFISTKEEGLNVGHIIQDILLEGRFAPDSD